MTDETTYQRANRRAEAIKAARNANKSDAWRFVDWAHMLSLMDAETVSRPTEAAAFRAMMHRKRGTFEEFEPAIYAPPTDSTGVALKYCSRCGDWRNRRAFGPDKRNRDGLRSYCRECENEMRRDRYARRVA